MTDEKIALVTGAGRGFGRATAVALHRAGNPVVAVGRDPAQLRTLRDELGPDVETVVADVTDPVVAGSLIDRFRPRTLVLNAGAAPLMRPVHEHTWESFSRTWEVDVRHAFHWIREALLRPLAPGSTVIAMSSAAALRGSPLSGGYAGAKAAIRDLAAYSADESDRAGLGLRFFAVLPKLTPATELGAAAVSAYARRAGTGVAAYLEGFGPTLDPAEVGRHLTDLAGSSAEPGAYLLLPDGLRRVPG